MIPTYNEAENIEIIVREILSKAKYFNPHILILDDNSTDGTGTIADSLSEEFEQVHVMHRPNKEGLGKAYAAGFKWGLERGYDFLCEMDADGSHRPIDLPKLFEAALNGKDKPSLIIGSRWVPDGGVENWPFQRKMLSKGGSLYARICLSLKVKDVTAGFRVYDAEIIKTFPLDEIESSGYCFQIDLTLRTSLNKSFGIIEVPIIFVERIHGQSKMSGNIVKEAILNVGKWGFYKRFAKKKFKF